MSERKTVDITVPADHAAWLMDNSRSVDERERICREAITKWGLNEQLAQLSEECCELGAAANQLRRDRKWAREGVIEEIADVVIMCAQVGMVIDPTGKDVEQAIKQKLARLEGKLRAT